MRAVICASLLLPMAAWGQSFNCDLDILSGGPEVGNGVPSDSFGAAANQPGRWNMLNGSGGSARQLLGLDGILTEVWYHKLPQGGSRAGYNNPINTGDYALLLNDVMLMGGAPIIMTLSGIQNGWYRVYTYAVKASVPPQYSPTEVSVEGSTTPNPQVVTGPMPGNSFAEGITHSVHDVLVAENSLRIIISDSNPVAHVNGFQIVAVPEPISAVSLAAGFVVLLLRRKDASHD